MNIQKHTIIAQIFEFNIIVPYIVACNGNVCQSTDARKDPQISM